MRTVANLKRLALLVAAALGGLVYVWIAAVRAVPAVRARKAERRAARRRRPS
jgi:hypothetical protein